MIGACKIVPPSPAAAMLLISWMFGVDPMQPYWGYRELYAAVVGEEQTKVVEQCFLDWPGDTP